MLALFASRYPFMEPAHGIERTAGLITNIPLLGPTQMMKNRPPYITVFALPAGI